MSEAELQRMHLDAIGRLDPKWQMGYYRRLSERHPALLKKIDKAEDHLNDVWSGYLKGSATIQQFEKALEAWESLHRIAIGRIRSLQ